MQRELQHLRKSNVKSKDLKDVQTGHLGESLPAWGSCLQPGSESQLGPGTWREQEGLLGGNRTSKGTQRGPSESTQLLG